MPVNNTESVHHHMNQLEMRVLTMKLVSFLEKWRTSIRPSGQQKNPDMC